jgi:hypothetical protein
MALINREQALSHPFANGQYDKEHADEHFIMGFEDYKEWLEDLPTVEAIPKADYEARLKADMVAMLKEIQLECEENTVRWYVGRVDGKSDDVILIDTLNEVIQQKINALKGE